MTRMTRMTRIHQIQALVAQALTQVQVVQVINTISYPVLDAVKQLTREDVLKQYGHYAVLMLSFERLVFTYAVRIVRSDCELKILITVGDGTPEGICGLKLTEFCEPAQISSLKFDAVEVYKRTSAGTTLIEEF